MDQTQTDCIRQTEERMTPHIMFGNRMRKQKVKTLDTFYQWCRKIGHYESYEAVERYRRI
jgi:hypothetical protein